MECKKMYDNLNSKGSNDNFVINSSCSAAAAAFVYFTS